MVQCPNCGGYRVLRFERTPKPKLKDYLWAFILILSWIGAIFGVLMLLGLMDDAKKWKEEEGNPWFDGGHRCELCGYRWIQKPGYTPRVQHNPDLIRRGEERLREEARLRSAEDDLFD